MTIIKKRFQRGIILKADDIGADGITGELKVGLTSQRLHVYLEGQLRTVVTQSQTQELTNKTIDADLNTITNIETENLKTGVLNTSSTFTGATDTQLPSALAVKTAIDAINADVVDDVEGPASSTDNAIARFDGVTGKVIKNSSVTIDEVGVIGRSSGLTLFASAGDLTFTPVNTGKSTFNYAVKHKNSVFRPSFTDSTAGANASITVGDKSTIVLTSATSVDTLIPHLDFDGQIVTLINGSAGTILLNNETGAIAGARIITGTGTNYSLPVGASVSLIYSTTTSRWSITGASGVKGPTSSTDNTLPRFDGTTGQVIQGSGITVSDANEITGATVVVANNTITTAASGNLAATELNAALSELQTDIDTRALQSSLDTTNTNLTNHLNDATDAHDASAISVVPAGNLSSTDVQSALTELQTDVDTNSTAISNHISDTVDAHDASAISVVPFPGIASTNAQTALEEVYSTFATKVDANGGTLTDGQIITPSRLDVKQDTLANLTTYAATATNGQIVFATDEKKMYQIVDNALVAVGSGSGTGGGTTDVDILFQQTFDTASLGDFTQTGLVLDTTSPLHGTTSAKLVHQAGTSQSFKQVFSVDEKFRGKSVTVSFDITSTASAGNVTLKIYDETNAADIIASESITISSSVARQTTSFIVPATCLSMSYTFTALPEAGTPVTEIDDVVFRLSETALLETSFSVDVPVESEWLPSGLTAADFTGFGTVSNIEIQTKRQGSDLLMRGSFTPGTATAVEARISLKHSGVALTSAGSPRITSLSLAGDLVRAASSSTFFRNSILIEPSAGYITFGSQGSTSDAMTKALGTSMGSVKTSFNARIPIQNWSATETVTKSIPLTQSGLIQEADSYIEVGGANGTGSTATTVRRFTTIFDSKGSDISYVDSPTAGGTFTVNTSGIYSIDFAEQSTANSGDAGAYIYVNGIYKSGNRDIYNTANTNAKAVSASFTGYLTAGDVITAVIGSTTTNNGAYSRIYITKQGSLKQVNVNTNSKITIPTSSVSFSDGTALASGDGVTVKFANLANIKGDAFTVTNTSTAGTYVTMTKKGIVHVTACLYLNTANISFYIKVNNEYVARSLLNTAQLNTISWSGWVNVGDVIRVEGTAGTTPITANASGFDVLFQEQEVQVSVSNTLPQFSESDSGLRVDTSAGYGSTGVNARRFSSVRENIGTDIQYVPSAVDGDSFVTMSDGVYNIVYTDTFTVGSTLAISLNSPATTLASSITSPNVLARSATQSSGIPETVSWQGYLAKGSVIRAHTNAGVNNGIASFTISKVGKPNVTGVDVTPFVNVPQPISQNVTISQNQNSMSDITGGLQYNLATATINNSGSSGIISLVNDVTNTRTLFTALKTCEITISSRAVISAAGQGLVISTTSGKNIGISNDSYTTNTAVTVAGSTILQAGDSIVITSGAALQNAASLFVTTITATALSDQILTAPETFSTDTAPLTYASSSQYTLSTLANAPVGTYITFTYAANTNTRTQTTGSGAGNLRPTQTDADMNANGIRLYTRAYNAASTGELPAAIAIQIGKGLKGVSLNLYKDAGKVNSGTLDFYMNSTTSQGGVLQKTYNENTGILLIDAGWAAAATIVSGVFLFSDVSSAVSGYLTINASKNPALTGFGLNRVAARYTSTSGQAIGSTVTDLKYETKVLDTHNAYNTSTGEYTVPEDGFYSISSHYATASYTPSNDVNSMAILILVNGSTTLQTFTRTGSVTATTYPSGSVVGSAVPLKKGDIIKVQGTTTIASTMSTISSANHFSITKVSL